MLFLRGITVCLVLAVAPAFCAFTTYDNRGLWTSDVTALTTIDFENFSLTPTYGPGGVVFGNPGYSLSADCTDALSAGQACFMNTAGLGYAISPGEGPAPAANKHFRLVDSSAYLQIKVASGFKAAGLDLSTVRIDNRPVNIEVTTAVSGITTFNGVTPGFWGFTTDESVTMIRLSTAGQAEIFLDRIDFSDTAPPSNVDTPESTSLSYMGLGVLALWFGARKQVPSMRRGNPRQS